MKALKFLVLVAITVSTFGAFAESEDQASEAIKLINADFDKSVEHLKKAYDKFVKEGQNDEAASALWKINREEEVRNSRIEQVLRQQK